MSRRNLGFTLVELMVALALGLFVVAVVLTTFVASSRNQRAIEQATRHVENARYAMQILSEDIRHAGFFAVSMVSGTAPPAALPDPCETAVADITPALPLAVQGYDNQDPNLACLGGGLRKDSDVLVIRRAKTCVAGATGCDAPNANRLYFQASQCVNDPAPDFALGTHGALVKTALDCNTIADRREMLVHIYFIADRVVNGVSVPTLMRWELGSGVVALVDGIENLQIEYGVDDDGDGAPEVYLADPAAADLSKTAGQNWQNVTALRVHLLSRGVEPSPGYKDEKVYQLGLKANGAAQIVGPLNDAHRRHLYSVIAVIKNIAGRREG